MSEKLIRSRRCKGRVRTSNVTVVSVCEHYGKTVQAMKPESEDLPYCSVSFQLRTMTDVMRAGLEKPFFVAPILPVKLVKEVFFIVWNLSPI